MGDGEAAICFLFAVLLTVVLVVGCNVDNSNRWAHEEAMARIALQADSLKGGK